MATTSKHKFLVLRTRLASAASRATRSFNIQVEVVDRTKSGIHQAIVGMPRSSDFSTATLIVVVAPAFQSWVPQAQETRSWRRTKLKLALEMSVPLKFLVLRTRLASTASRATRYSSSMGTNRDRFF